MRAPDGARRRVNPRNLESGTQAYADPGNFFFIGIHIAHVFQVRAQGIGQIEIQPGTPGLILKGFRFAEGIIHSCHGAAETSPFTLL